MHNELPEKITDLHSILLSFNFNSLLPWALSDWYPFRHFEFWQSEPLQEMFEMRYIVGETRCQEILCGVKSIFGIGSFLSILHSFLGKERADALLLQVSLFLNSLPLNRPFWRLTGRGGQVKYFPHSSWCATGCQVFPGQPVHRHTRAKFRFLIFFFLSKFAKKVKIRQN